MNADRKESPMRQRTYIAEITDPITGDVTVLEAATPDDQHDQEPR